jgi:type I restriction enzyme S subunit
MNPSSQSYAVTRANGREYPWRMVRLGDIVTQVSRLEKVEAGRRYRLLGVRLDGNGAFLREERDGAEMSAARVNRVSAGDFIYSRLFAWRGAFDVVDEALDGCFVSNEFPTFACDQSRIDARFLNYFFRLKPTLTRVEADCTGSTPQTRNRFKERFFLNLTIPLPPLPEQKRIVAKVQSLTSKIDEARELRESINTDRIAALRSLFRRITDGAPRRPMSEIAPLERRPVQIKEDECYPELGIRSFGRGTFHKPALKGSEITWQKLFRIHSGDIVLSNIKAWEGAIGVATEEDHNRVGSHRYLTCVVNPDAATTNFVCFYLLTREGLEHVGHASPGSADRNRTLGMRALMGIPVPVPPLHMQHNFDCAHRQMTETTVAEADSGKKLNALMPSILDRAFKGEL